LKQCKSEKQLLEFPEVVFYYAVII